MRLAVCILAFLGLTTLAQVLPAHRHAVPYSAAFVPTPFAGGVLVGFWPLDETTSTRFDYSGYANHLSPSNSVSYDYGMISNAVSITGTNNFLSIPSNANLLWGTNSFGMTVWCILNSTNANQPILTKDNSTAGQRDFELLYRKSTGQFEFFVWDNLGTLHSVSSDPAIIPVSTNLWTHLTAYWNTNSGCVIIRVNGIQTGYTCSVSNITTAGTADLRIGATADNLAFMDGKVDQARIWKDIAGVPLNTNALIDLFYSDLIRITNSSDLQAARDNLNSTIFGSTNLPSEIGSLATTNSPITVTNYASVSYLTMTNYLSRPRIWVSNGPFSKQVVILHQGHTGTYGDYNYPSALQTYLNYGLSVCGLVMPGGDDITSGTSASHNTGTNSLASFVGPVIVAINTLTNASYTNIYMSGLSGGGWTTVFASACDTRITKSYPTCGSLPEYYPSSRDWEQLRIDRAVRQTYPELYVLGASPGRTQVQINYITDACCFNQADFAYAAPYTNYVSTTATNLSASTYYLDWENYTTHQFESNVITSVVLPDLLGNQTLLGGLAAYWKLDEASGARVDSVSTNNLGSTNSVGSAAGIISNAAYFQSASTQYLGVAASTVISVGSYDFSFAGWVKLIDKTAQHTIISQYDAADSKRSFFLLYNNTGDRFQFNVSSNGIASASQAANTLGSPSTNTWYFVYAYYDQQAASIGISVNNGNVDSTSSANGVFKADTPMTVGGNYNGGSGIGSLMNGYIDELGYWKRKLSARELAILYNSGAGRTYPFVP